MHNHFFLLSFPLSHLSLPSAYCIPVCLCSDRKSSTVAEKVANKSFKDFGLPGMLSDRVILGMELVYQTREMPCREMVWHHNKTSRPLFLKDKVFDESLMCAFKLFEVTHLVSRLKTNNCPFFFELYTVLRYSSVTESTFRSLNHSRDVA